MAGKKENKIELIQGPRVSISRERTVNLGRFGFEYESEKVFISIQTDLDSCTVEDVLERTETLLDTEVNKIEKFYAGMEKLRRENPKH